MSKYGLGCDNVLAADMVLADGRIVKASAHENADLYWAIRGGGGNFGIVTAFEIALHPVSTVFAGNITLESEHPQQLLRTFRDFLPTAPEELTLIALMSRQPDHMPRLNIQACYIGEQGEAEKVLAPLRRDLAVVRDSVQSRPYLQLEQMVPADIPPTYDAHCGGFFAQLDDQRIEVLAAAFLTAMIPVGCFLIHLHGAVTRVPLAATPFPLRRSGIAFDVAASWTAANGQRAAREWIETLNAKLPIDEDGNYVNDMDRVGESSVRRAYGANYAQLQRLKTRYDPHNLFSLNQNIRPA
jgi:FAD/FMN-containing dehydrogenase